MTQVEQTARDQIAAVIYQHRWLAQEGTCGCGWNYVPPLGLAPGSGLHCDHVAEELLKAESQATPSAESYLDQADLDAISLTWGLDDWDKTLESINAVIARVVDRLPKVELVKSMTSPMSCVVTQRGHVIFNGVDRTALIRSKGKW